MRLYLPLSAPISKSRFDPPVRFAAQLRPIGDVKGVVQFGLGVGFANPDLGEHLNELRATLGSRRSLTIFMGSPRAQRSHSPD
jgi:hypothetical protein